MVVDRLLTQSYSFLPNRLMKHTLITLAVTSLLASTAFAAPIHFAASENDTDGIQAELDKGVNVNIKMGNGGVGAFAHSSIIR